jgi:c-di-GMP-related signal transduction protein
MYNEDNQYTPEYDCIMQMYSIIHAILLSDKTPMVTKLATVQTLKRALENEQGPFHKSEELMMLASVIANQSNELVMEWMKKARQEEGKGILDSIDFSKN